MGHAYFDERLACSQIQTWAAATGMQLDRWEPLVAQAVLDGFDSTGRPAKTLIWQARVEHHFCLVAASHLLVSLNMSQLRVSVPQPLRDELKEVRDLHEHWKDNMPVFNITSRTNQPQYPSGRAYAARNPTGSPYWWLRWDNENGPKLTPNVSASKVRDLLDRAVAATVQKFPDMTPVTVPPVESPWIHDPESGDQWLPRPTPGPVQVTEADG